MVNLCVVHQNQSLFPCGISLPLVFYCVKFLQWEWAFRQQLCVLNINAQADLTENIYRLCVCMCMCLDHKRPQGTPEPMVSECRIWDSSFLQVFFLSAAHPVNRRQRGLCFPLYPLSSNTGFNVISSPFYNTISSILIFFHLYLLCIIIF